MVHTEDMLQPNKNSLGSIIYKTLYLAFQRMSLHLMNYLTWFPYFFSKILWSPDPVLDMNDY